MNCLQTTLHFIKVSLSVLQNYPVIQLSDILSKLQNIQVLNIVDTTEAGFFVVCKTILPLWIGNSNRYFDLLVIICESYAFFNLYVLKLNFSFLSS